MKADAILKADVLDIIFENKNKSYGAYALRKFYNNRLYKALGVMIGFVIILCTLVFIKKDKVVLITHEFPIEPGLVAPPKDPKQPEKPKKITPPVTATPRKPVLTDMHTTVVITKNPVVPPVTDLRGGAVIDTRRIDLPTGGDGPIPIQMHVSGGGGKDTTATANPVKPIDKITPSDFAEEMPTYPGGMAALRKFLEKNLQNPEDIEAGQIVGVKIKFVVGYDGVLKSFETVEDGGTAFNNEVIRVLKKMKPWNPGKTKGENVSVYYTIPVKFTTTE